MLAEVEIVVWGMSGEKVLEQRIRSTVTSTRVHHAHTMRPWSKEPWKCFLSKGGEQM
jgi:pyruvate/2-oxoacid:ferredoxin oxidoreductase alpha subunit